MTGDTVATTKRLPRLKRIYPLPKAVAHAPPHHRLGDNNRAHREAMLRERRRANIREAQKKDKEREQRWSEERAARARLRRQHHIATQRELEARAAQRALNMRRERERRLLQAQREKKEAQDKMDQWRQGQSNLLLADQRDKEIQAQEHERHLMRLRAKDETVELVKRAAREVRWQQEQTEAVALHAAERQRRLANVVALREHEAKRRAASKKRLESLVRYPPVKGKPRATVAPERRSCSATSVRASYDPFAAPTKLMSHDEGPKRRPRRRRRRLKKSRKSEPLTSPLADPTDAQRMAVAAAAWKKNVANSMAAPTDAPVKDAVEDATTGSPPVTTQDPSPKDTVRDHITPIEASDEGFVEIAAQYLFKSFREQVDAVFSAVLSVDDAVPPNDLLSGLKGRHKDVERDEVVLADEAGIALLAVVASGTSPEATLWKEEEEKKAPTVITAVSVTGEKGPPTPVSTPVCEASAMTETRADANPPAGKPAPVRQKRRPRVPPLKIPTDESARNSYAQSLRSIFKSPEQVKQEQEALLYNQTDTEEEDEYGNDTFDE